MTKRSHLYQGKPDIEEGYYGPIARELMYSLAVAPLSGSEFRVIAAVLHETYCQKGQPSWTRLSLSQLANLSKLTVPTCSKAVKKLIEKKILKRARSGQSTQRLSFHKYYFEWSIFDPKEIRQWALEASPELPNEQPGVNQTASGVNQTASGVNQTASKSCPEATKSCQSVKSSCQMVKESCQSVNPVPPPININDLNSTRSKPGAREEGEGGQFSRFLENSTRAFDVASGLINLFCRESRQPLMSEKALGTLHRFLNSCESEDQGLRLIKQAIRDVENGHKKEARRVYAGVLWRAEELLASGWSETDESDFFTPAPGQKVLNP